MSTISDEERDEIVTAAVERVSAELVLPLLLGATTLATVIGLDPDVGRAVAAHLHRCPTKRQKRGSRCSPERVRVRCRSERGWQASANGDDQQACAIRPGV